MTGVEIAVAIVAVIAPAVVAAVGYLWRKTEDHTIKIAKIETRQDGLIAHLSADMAEIKGDLKVARGDVQQIKERLAGME